MPQEREVNIENSNTILSQSLLLLQEKRGTIFGLSWDYTLNSQEL